MDKDASCTVAAIADEGYYVFKNIFNDDEIQTIRTLTKEYFKSSGECRFGGFLELRAMQRVPDLAKIIINDRFLAMMMSCTSPNMPLLTGECDLHMNTLSKWHKDIDVDNQGEWKELAYRPDGWGVFKAALYLQPQSSRSSNALKVRPKSHKYRLGAVTQTEALGVEPGDVIVFDMRLDHAGLFPSPVDRLIQKFLKSGGRWLKRDHETWYTLLRAGLRMIGKKSERIAVYLTFGGPNPATYAYQKFARPYHGSVPAKLGEQIQTKLANWNIGIIEG